MKQNVILPIDADTDHPTKPMRVGRVAQMTSSVVRAQHDVCCDRWGHPCAECVTNTGEEKVSAAKPKPVEIKVQ